MLIGYARTSTLDQKAGLDAQVEELRALGCEDIFVEQVSSVSERAQLDAAIRFARKGDVLVCTKLDRLARSVPQMWDIVQQLEAKGVAIRIENLGINTTTPTGKLIMNVLGGIAQFEREMMLERQRIGIKAARNEGKYRGRVPTARRQSDEVIRLKGEGKRNPEIMKALGISRASLYRILQEQAEA